MLSPKALARVRRRDIGVAHDSVPFQLLKQWVSSSASELGRRLWQRADRRKGRAPDGCCARHGGGAGAGGGGEGGGGLTVQGLSIAKPPSGSQVTAIGLVMGEILWQIAHGDTADNVRNHPALKGLDIPRTGQAGIIGTRLS